MDIGGMTTTKRMTDFHNIAQFKLIGGSSVKNNTGAYKNPFFSALKLGQKYDDHTLDLVNVKSQNSTDARRPASTSYHKLKKNE